MQNASKIVAAEMNRMMITPFGRKAHGYAVFYSVSRKPTGQRGIGHVAGSLHSMPKQSEPRPLWTCPACRRQFKNRNQSHSCGQFTVEQLLAGMPPQIVELYERLDDVIRRCGEVVVAPTKTRVLF